MNRPQKTNEGSTRGVRVFFLAWVIMTGVGTAYPQLRLWGFHLPAFLPVWLQAVFFGMACIVLIFPNDRYAGILRFLAPVGRIIRSPLSALLLLAAFIVFQSSTGLLGDGILRGREADTGVYNPLELLPSVLASSVFDLGHEPFGWDGQQALAITSILAGCGFLLIIWFFPRRIWTKTDERHTARLLLVSAGTTALFFGYIESYAFAAMATIGFLLSAEAFRRRKGAFGITAALFLLAVVSHISALTLYPAFAILAIQRKKLKYLLTTGIIGLAMPVWIYWIIHSSSVAAEVSVGSMIIPWTATGQTDYTLFSGAHFLDIVNLFALVTPGVLVALPLLRHARSAQRGVANNAFWLMAAIVPMGMLLFMDPKLGMARDWDLFALSIIPILVWAAVRLAGSHSLRPKGSLAAPVLAAVAMLAIFVGLNAHTESSIARYTILLDMDPSRSAYGHEILAMKYRQLGDIDAEIEHWQKANAPGDHTRYLTNLAAAYIRKGDIQKASSAAHRAFALNTSYSFAAYTLGTVFYEQDMLDSAFVYYSHAAFLDPKHANSHYFLAMTLQRQGQVEKAREEFEAAIRLEPNDEDYHNGLAGLLIDAGDYAGADAAVAKALQLNPQHAHSRINLALLYLKTGRAERALEELSTVMSYPDLDSEQRAYIVYLYAQIQASLNTPKSSDETGSPAP